MGRIRDREDKTDGGRYGEGEDGMIREREDGMIREREDRMIREREDKTRVSVSRHSGVVRHSEGKREGSRRLQFQECRC